MSIVPFVVAAEGSGRDNSGNGNAEELDDDSEREDKVEIRKETMVKDDEQRMKAVEKIRTAGLDVENKVEIRVKQREHFEAMIEKCKEVRDVEDCEEDLRERLAMVDKLEEKDLERLEKIREKREEVASKLEELKKKEHFMKFKMEGSKARIVVKEKMERAEKKFDEARDGFEDSKKKQKNERDAFVDARKKWKADCKSNADSDACKKVDGELKNHAINYLKHTMDSIAHELEKVRQRIEGSDTLTEAEAADMLARLEAKTAQAAALKLKIEGLTEESTTEEVRAVTDDVKKLWAELKHDLKEHAGRVVNSRMGGVLIKSERMTVKLAKVLERMAEKGADTGTVEELVNQFNAHLDASKAAYEKAQGLFKAAAGLKGEQKGAKIKEAQASMKVAQGALKEAHDVLQDIHKALKEQRQLETLEDVEDDEAEGVDEEDEEDDADDAEEK